MMILENFFMQQEVELRYRGRSSFTDGVNFRNLFIYSLFLLIYYVSVFNFV